MKKNKKIVVLVLLFILIAGLSFIFYKWYTDKNHKNYGDSSSIYEVSYNYSNGIPKFIDGNFSSKKVSSSNDALDVLEEIKEQMKIKDVYNEFNLDYEEKSNDITYYRFNQVYNDISVLNQNIILSVDSEGNVLSLSGYYIPNIEIDTNPKLNKEEIVNIVKSDLGENAVIISNDLAIWNNNEDNYLVYVVRGYSNNLSGEYIVDANLGTILVFDNALNDADVYSYKGKGLDDKNYTINLEKYYDINSFKYRYRFYDPMRSISIADYRFIGEIAGYFISTLPGTLPIEVDLVDDKIDMTWENETFIQSAISTMANYEIIYDYYKSVLGRDSYDNKGSKLIINLGVTSETFSNKDLNNAFWGRLTHQIYIGNYNGKSLSASLDVLAHEFTHGVVDFTSKFVSYPKKENENKAFESGALNEGYGDILGSLIEDKNWTIAEDNVILRDATDPIKYNCAAVKGGEKYWPDGYLTDGTTIEELLEDKELDSVADFDRGGEHKNSTVVSRAAYLMYDANAFKNKDEMAKVWYNSLYLLSSYANFEDCALAVIKTAKNMGLKESSIYKITQAFIDTKMLDEKNYELSGTVKSGEELLKDVNIEIKSYKDGSVIKRIKTDENGNYSWNLLTGTYEITFSKEDFESVTKYIYVNGEMTLDVTLKSMKVNENNSNNNQNNNFEDDLSGKNVNNLCTSNNCVYLTFWSLEDMGSDLDQQSITYKINKGSVFDYKVIVKELNKSFGNDIIDSDGTNFYISMGGFTVDIAWYYKGTKDKFDWSKAILENTEVEMKMFDGLFGDDTFQDIYDMFN